MSLDRYTDQQLVDELMNRRLERELGQDSEEIRYCDECVHFRFWTRRSEVPEDYNPCSAGHMTVFRYPMEGEAPDAEYGHYRRSCRDREQRQPPPPAPPAGPPPASRDRRAKRLA